MYAAVVCGKKKEKSLNLSNIFITFASHKKRKKWIKNRLTAQKASFINLQNIHIIVPALLPRINSQKPRNHR